MNDWDKIVDNGFDVPADRPLPELVNALSEDLRSPDPVLRDRRAYAILATWIGRDVLSESALLALGDDMAARFEDPEIQARTFAPLILDSIVSKGVCEARWVEAFARWYPAETDLRGHDVSLGWLHAVAHGADLLGAFGRHPSVAPETMLDLAAQRLVARTPYVWSHMEDDRLGCAVALTLTRPELSEEQACGWLTLVADELAARDRSGIEPYVSNILRTLRVVYLLADRGVRIDWQTKEIVALAHRNAVRERLAETLAVTATYAG